MSEKKKVSELTASTTVADDDLIMIVQEDGNEELDNFKQTRANFMANYYKKNETYSKTEIDTKVASVYKYKGTVATYNDLPSTGLTVGDVYNVETDGSNYAWTGTEWDKLGGTIDLTNYVTNTDYATDSKGGVIKANVNGFFIGSTGNPSAGVYSNEAYQNLQNYCFIGKGTLENVLTARIGDIDTILDNINGENI